MNSWLLYKINYFMSYLDEEKEEKKDLGQLILDKSCDSLSPYQSDPKLLEDYCAFFNLPNKSISSNSFEKPHHYRKKTTQF